MIAIITTKDLSCQHPQEDMEYQPQEEDTNTLESLTCGICGMELDPEICAPDWDEMGKEERYEENDE
tara:strand:+ start:598 stop:798 length:201 start_codon:yes stop_codon:yes gene_type:complete